MLRLDHLILAVYDLSTAVESFTALGFTVTPGGVHASGATHNALIVFADGTYLEIMAPTGEPAKPDAPDYTFLFARGEGWAGMCLSSDDLPADLAQMAERGANVGSIGEGGRVRPDGVEMRWQSAWIDEQALPFVMQDLTDRALRVNTDPSRTTHANGATGIAEVFVTDSPWGVPVPLNRRFEAVFGMADERGVFTCGDITLWMTPPGGTHDAVTGLKLHGLAQAVSAHGVTIEPVG
ncbi:MAG: VOC family protein [Anaerolineae bacterium]|jgi:hypothetical protein|nr:VOC family protein [Anaerolineae bacterium]